MVVLHQLVGLVAMRVVFDELYNRRGHDERTVALLAQAENAKVGKQTVMRQLVVAEQFAV